LEFFVFFLEALDPAGRVDQFLLAGEKWMAAGTNLDAYVFLRGPDFNGISAGTLDGRMMIIWMDAALHLPLTP
jgi:hypothetical protein